MHNEKFSSALESLHADDGLADRALERARSGKPAHRRRGAAKPISTVIALAVAGLLATGGVAYAVVNSEFFATAWGDHGGGQVQSSTTTWDDGSVHTYTMEFGDGTAPTELEDYVEHVGITLEANGYTLFVGDLTMDANAAGAVTMTLSNPDGVPYYEPAAEDGELVLNGTDSDHGLDQIAMLFGDDFADERCYIDREASTSTEVHFTMYFASLNGAADLGRDITWRLDWSSGSTDYGNGSSAQTSAFRSTKQVGVKRFSMDDGTFAEVSPFSVRTQIAQAEDADLVRAAVVKRIALKFADGTEQLIYDYAGSTIGSYFGLSRDDGSTIHVPTKLVDPAEVTGVEMDLNRIHLEDGREVLGDPITVTLE